METSPSGREWREAYTASFQRRELAFSLHDKSGQTFTSRVTRIGDIETSTLKVYGRETQKKIAGGVAGIIIYREVVPDVDVFASISDIGVEWNIKLKGPDAPRRVEYEADLPIETPEAIGEIPSKDAEGSWAEIKITTERKTNCESERVVTVKEFTGRVSVRDPVTRKRSWSTDIKWPVRIR